MYSTATSNHGLCCVRTWITRLQRVLHVPKRCHFVLHRAVSDNWHGAEALLALSFKGLLLPGRAPPHTDLLDLDPLPVSALDDAAFAALYRFSHFNAIQTQVGGVTRQHQP